MYAAGRQDGGACGRQSWGFAGVLADHIDAMPPDVALVWKFTRAALAHDAFADEYREPIVTRSGRASLYRYAGIGACAA